MKTRIRTFIAICLLGSIGFISIHAISVSEKELVTDKAEMLSNESVFTDEAVVYSAQAYSDIDMNNEIAAFATAMDLAEENILSDVDLIYSAQAFSSVDIENEIAENETNQIFPDENAMTNEMNYSAKAFAARDFENELKNRP